MSEHPFLKLERAKDQILQILTIYTDGFDKTEECHNIGSAARFIREYISENFKGREPLSEITILALADILAVNNSDNRGTT